MSSPSRRPCEFRSLHGCRIAKRLPQIALDTVLGREVELLKELGGNGDGSGGPDTVEGCPIGVLSTHCEVVVVHVSMTVAICEVFLKRWVVVVGGILKRAVVVHCGYLSSCRVA